MSPTLRSFVSFVKIEQFSSPGCGIAPKEVCEPRHASLDCIDRSKLARRGSREDPIEILSDEETEALKLKTAKKAELLLSTLKPLQQPQNAGKKRKSPDDDEVPAPKRVKVAEHNANRREPRPYAKIFAKLEQDDLNKYERESGPRPYAHTSEKVAQDDLNKYEREARPYHKKFKPNGYGLYEGVHPRPQKTPPPQPKSHRTTYRDYPTSDEAEYDFQYHPSPSPEPSRPRYPSPPLTDSPKTKSRRPRRPSPPPPSRPTARSLSEEEWLDLLPTGMLRNHEVLRVEKTASRATIRRAWKALAFAYHEDKHPNNRDWARPRIQAINAAYEALKNGKNKKAK